MRQRYVRIMERFSKTAKQRSRKNVKTVITINYNRVHTKIAKLLVSDKIFTNFEIDYIALNNASKYYSNADASKLDNLEELNNNDQQLINCLTILICSLLLYQPLRIKEGLKNVDISLEIASKLIIAHCIISLLLEAVGLLSDKEISDEEINKQIKTTNDLKDSVKSLFLSFVQLELNSKTSYNESSFQNHIKLQLATFLQIVKL